MSIAEIKNPDDVVCTMRFTMKLKDWKQIKNTLNKNPAWAELQIINDIQDLVWQLEKTLHAGMGGKQDD